MRRYIEYKVSKATLGHLGGMGYIKALPGEQTNRINLSLLSLFVNTFI